MTTTTITSSRSSILMIVAIMMMGAMTMTTTTDAFSPLPTGSKKSIIIGGSRLLTAQPTALSASILDTTTTSTSATIDDDDEIWMALEQIAATHEKEKGRIMFHEKELVLQNEELATALSNRVNFGVPTTWEEANTVFWNQSQPQLLAFAALVSILFRFSLPSSFGVADLIAIGLTKAAWDVQEWSYHYRNFHGNNNDSNNNNGGKAHFPFQYHDHHHDLPYYHVAMEPTPVCAVYALSVTLLAAITYGIVDHFVAGAGGLLHNSAVTLQQLPGVIVTTHATFLVSSIHYVWVHYLAHSKVPLKGELQEARMHHIQHHINHQVNLNMASHTIDQLVGTTTPPTPSTKKQTSN